MVCGSAQYGECQSKIKKYISIVISEINEMKKKYTRQIQMGEIIVEIVRWF